jgi:2-(1,2-epoxy-1,2-dihydrophenyl)acetyl-CoA isomerase
MTKNEGAVTVSREGDIATIRLDRVEKRNALDAATAAELRHAIEEASSSRVTILTGTGRAFCAGGDLEELQRWSELGGDEIGSVLYETFQGMIRALRASDSIVIAAVNGAAVGAGMDLALACDLRVAARGVKLGQVWVGLGVIPGTGGAWLTPALAGPTKAAELLLTGDLISAEEALEAGLVNSVVDPEHLIEAAHALAARVLRNPKDGVVANKRALVAATQMQLEAALDHAREVQPGRFTSEEFKAAVGAKLG